MMSCLEESHVPMIKLPLPFPAPLSFPDPEPSDGAGIAGIVLDIGGI